MTALLVSVGRFFIGNRQNPDGWSPASLLTTIHAVASGETLLSATP